MTEPVGRIMVVPGSRRRGSLNRALADEVAVRLMARQHPAGVLDWADHELPLYDGDLEAAGGLPAAAAALKRRFHAAPALVFVSPEYNASFSPLLKNALDWVSRPDDGRCGRLEPFAGKPVLLFAASPGQLGGLRGLRHLREVLNQLGSIVMPREFAMGRAVLQDGRLVPGEKENGMIDEVLDQLAVAGVFGQPERPALSG